MRGKKLLSLCLGAAFCLAAVSGCTGDPKKTGRRRKKSARRRGRQGRDHGRHRFLDGHSSAGNGRGRGRQNDLPQTHLGRHRRRDGNARLGDGAVVQQVRHVRRAGCGQNGGAKGGRYVHLRGSFQDAPFQRRDQGDRSHLPRQRGLRYAPRGRSGLVAHAAGTELCKSAPDQRAERSARGDGFHHQPDGS